MFSERIKLAEEFQQSLFNKIKELGFYVAINGTEHTHPDYVRLIQGSIDQTSLSIRFQPDGVACIGRIPRSFYVEAKNSRFIERTAYEQYYKLHESGSLVVVVFGKLDWKWNFIEDIKLVSASETSSKYTDPFPIIDGWICPRKDGRWYSGLKESYSRASGTPYREIMKSSLNNWCDFKKTVIARCLNQPYISTTSHPYENSQVNFTNNN